jgi:tetratricopeptide (TPR) repeat protein
MKSKLKNCPTSMDESRRPRATISYWKKAVYGLLATCIFFLVVESLLAVFHAQPTVAVRDPFVGFESSLPLFVAGRDDDGVLLQTATNKLKFFNAQQFTRHKPDDTIRLFCLGGSTTFGRPYDDSTSFVGWLREFLQVADTNRKWEVINGGGISYASYRVASVLDELCDYSPDLFIIYTGHNEFLEERSYRDLRAQPAFVQRVTAILHRTRTYSLAHRLMTDGKPRSDDRAMLPSEVDAVLDHAVGPAAYERDDQLRADIGKHFEFNLTRMVKTARSVGAEVLLVTPAANLKDFSPFKSEQGPDLSEHDRRRWGDLTAQADVLERHGDTDQALVALKSASEIDDRRADLHFRLGRLLLAENRHVEARAAFQRAIDEDVCPLRVLSSFQRTVERVAVAHGAALIDFNSILRNDCSLSYGHDSPGREYFVDHVHPTIAAHRLLAMAIVEAMIQKGIVTPNQSWSDGAIAIATERIEARINPEMQSRALTNLAQVLSWAGKQDEAGPLAVEAVRLRSEHGLSDDSESMFYAAVHHAMTGSDGQAIALLEKVVESEPGNSEARWRLATLLFDQMRYEQAEVQFREAVRLNPADAVSHQMLGILSLKFSRYQQALESFQRAQALIPNDESVRDNIAFTLKQLDRGQDTEVDRNGAGN